MHTHQDVKAVLQEAQNQGHLPPALLAEADTLLHALVAHPELAAYFQPGWHLYTETAIALPGGTILQPDRLQSDGKQAMVLEYKTGQPSEDDQPQLAKYLHAVQALGLAPTVRGHLVYLQAPLVVQAVAPAPEPS